MYPDVKSTGVPGASRPTAAASSDPLIPGITTSVSTSAGRSRARRNSSIAMAPLSASSTR